MLEIIKMQLKEYIDRMDQSDEKFLKQILTIVRKHCKAVPSGVFCLLRHCYSNLPLIKFLASSEKSCPLSI